VDTIGRQVTAFVTMFMAAGLIILMYMIFEPQRQAAASNHQVHTAVERGAELFAENCVVCHGTKGEGRQGAGFTLNTEDNKAPDDETRAFLFNTIARGRQNSLGTEPNMPAFLNTEGGAFNEQQINDVITFIGCASDEEWNHVEEIVTGELGTPVPLPPVPNLGTPNARILPGAPSSETPTAAAGQEVDPGANVFETHCISCHKISPEFPQGKGVGPNLTGIAIREIPSRPPIIPNQINVQEEQEEGLTRWIRNPASVRPGSGMPAFGPDKISDSDMQALTSWLMEHTEAGAAEETKTCYRKTSR
jgi:mono/diheme cytochrome c family protein